MLEKCINIIRFAFKGYQSQHPLTLFIITQNEGAQPARLFPSIVKRPTLLNSKGFYGISNGIPGLGLEPAGFQIYNFIECARSVETQCVATIDLASLRNLSFCDPTFGGKAVLHFIAVGRSLRSG